MIEVKKAFTLSRVQLGRKFRVENNNLDITALIAASGFKVDRIGNLAPAHREERNRKETASEFFNYVQISDIDIDLGRIRSFRRCRGDQAPNNARRVMREGDILVSTRRPTRGAIVAVPKEFDGEICTVFFTTLRVKDKKKIDPRFLALFLRTSLGRHQFSSLITETAYPVISDDDVEGMQILLPSIAVQRRLADSYDESVTAYFARLNAAHSEITKARQTIETDLLADFAEKLQPKTFGLVEEDTTVDVEEENQEAL